jgi:hypothetical protein
MDNVTMNIDKILLPTLKKLCFLPGHQNFKLKIPILSEPDELDISNLISENPGINPRSTLGDTQPVLWLITS